MAGEDRRIQVRIDGNAEGIVAAMQQAENAVQTHTRTISGHFGELSGSINKIVGIVGTMTAVLAGGAAFKSFISESQAWTGETLKLAKALGTTTEEAGAWKVAAHSLGVEQDVLEGTSMKLSRTLASNQGVFDRLGIEVKDASTGALLPMTTIIENTVTRLNQMEPGVNRNAAASLLFGRSWKDSMGILKMTGEAIEEGKKELQSLGLEVGPERVQQFVQYRTEMKYIGLVAESLKIQVGNALMPALISMGQWFHDIGPGALFVFQGALKGVITFVEYATLGVRLLWETWKALWGQFSTTSISLVQIITQIISGDFAGAWQTAKKGIADFGQYGVTWFDNMEAASKRTNERVAKLWGVTAATAAKSAHQKGENFDLDGGKGGSEGEDPALQRENQYIQIYNRLQDERQKGAIQGNVLLDETQKKLAEINLKYQDLIRTYPEHRLELLRNMALDQEQVKTLQAIKEAEDARKKTADYLNPLGQLSEEQQKSLDKNSQTSTWSAHNSDADSRAEQARTQFMGQGETELDRLNKEREQAEQHWAMMANSDEEYQRRRLQIEEIYSRKRQQIERNETQAKLGMIAGGFGTAASLADAFYQLSGQKSKAAFRVYQMAKSGETIVSTASAAMKAFDDGAKTNYWLGIAQAAATVLYGGTQLAMIWQASPEGGGGGSGGGYAGGGVSDLSGYNPSSQVVTQPQSNVQAQQQGNVTIQIGSVYGDKAQLSKWAEEELIPVINEAGTRSVRINYAT
jgi:hypothetical protein